MNFPELLDDFKGRVIYSIVNKSFSAALHIIGAGRFHQKRLRVT